MFSYRINNFNKTQKILREIKSPNQLAKKNYFLIIIKLIYKIKKKIALLASRHKDEGLNLHKM